MYKSQERPCAKLINPSKPPGCPHTNHDTSCIMYTKLNKNPRPPSTKIIGSIFFPLFSMLAPNGSNKNGIIV